jgi:uncharacterized protein (DUF2267 family)
MILEFEKYANEGNHFVNEVANQLGCERAKAARLTQVVLHALRDRLPVNEAVHVSQGLPMALKGIFIDQYEVGRVPVVLRNKEDFLMFIWNKLSNPKEFESTDEIADGFRAVYTVLSKHLSPGQMEKLNNSLHSEILELVRTGSR